MRLKKNQANEQLEGTHKKLHKTKVSRNRSFTVSINQKEKEKDRVSSQGRNKVAIVSYGTKLNKNSCINIGSFLLFGYDVHIYTLKSFPMHRRLFQKAVKPIAYKRFCEKRRVGDEETIIFADLFDIISVRPKEEFLKFARKKMKKEKKKVIFSGEGDLWPFFNGGG